MTKISRFSRRMASFDDSDSAVDANDLLFVEHYFSGKYPYAQSATLSRAREAATLLPPGAKPHRVAVFDGTRSVLAAGPGWVSCSIRWPQGNARINVVAVSEQLAKEVLEASRNGAQEPKVVDHTKADVGFWHLASHPSGKRQDQRSRGVRAAGQGGSRGFKEWCARTQGRRPHQGRCRILAPRISSERETPGST